MMLSPDTGFHQSFFATGNSTTQQCRNELGRARLHSLRKKSILLLVLGAAAVRKLVLGGAALHRCDKRILLNTALAAEGAVVARKRLFPQTAQPCRPGQK
jgi:hypothetical protein